MDHCILKTRIAASFFPLLRDCPVLEDKQLRWRFQRDRAVIIESGFRQCVFETGLGPLPQYRAKTQVQSRDTCLRGEGHISSADHVNCSIASSRVPRKTWRSSPTA